MKARHQFAALLLLVPVSAALAGAVPMTANIIQVSATSSDGATASFEEVFPVSSFNDSLSWTLPAPLTLRDNAGAAMGTIEDLKVTFNADPQVDLSFSIINNDLTNAVMYSVSTATISFAAINNPQAAASASMTLTQGAGSAAGGYTTGLLDGKAYQARYSSHPVIDTNTVFASLVPGLSFIGLGTSGTESSPVVGMTTILGPVTMMESQFAFVLSPGDQASGTSAFLVTPEPATLSVLLIGGLFLARRRR